MPFILLFRTWWKTRAKELYWGFKWENLFKYEQEWNSFECIEEQSLICEVTVKLTSANITNSHVSELLGHHLVLLLRCVCTCTCSCFSVMV